MDDRARFGQALRQVPAASRAAHRLRRLADFADWLIVAMYLWCVWHERPLCWGCDRTHYGNLFRPRNKLPSVSQFTRRVKSDRCQRILQLVHDELSGRRDVPADLLYIDGKPLPVGPVSKDKDARRGRVSGGFAKGYKLHAIVTADRRIVVFSVVPLNVAEQSVALELVPHLPPVLPDALLAGDGNYDSAPLHKRLAAGSASPAEDPRVALLTPLKGQGRVGPAGHDPQTLREMGPQRRAALELWERHPTLAWFVLGQRLEVERTFGVLCSFAGGLNGLPPWVRGLPRVRRWVGSKIILYHARLTAQRRLAA